MGTYSSETGKWMRSARCQLVVNGGKEGERTEVKVVKSPVGELLLARQKDVLLGMERVPTTR